MKTTQETSSIESKVKDAAISRKLLGLMAGGLSLEQAWDETFPMKPFKQFAGEIYDCLKSVSTNS